VAGGVCRTDEAFASQGAASIRCIRSEGEIMGEWAIARVIGILTCAGLIWVGIGFGAFALTTVLAPHLGPAGAAGLTSALLLIGPAFVGIFYGRRRSKGLSGLSDDASDTVLSAIASVARERPLLAVLGAALFGAVEVFLKAPRRNKSRKRGNPVDN
jgi:hypothetical protein